VKKERMSVCGPRNNARSVTPIHRCRARGLTLRRRTGNGVIGGGGKAKRERSPPPPGTRVQGGRMGGPWGARGGPSRRARLAPGARRRAGTPAREAGGHRRCVVESTKRRSAFFLVFADAPVWQLCLHSFSNPQIERTRTHMKKSTHTHTATQACHTHIRFPLISLRPRPAPGRQAARHRRWTNHPPPPWLSRQAGPLQAEAEARAL